MEKDTDLDRLAEAELLLEAKRGLARSNVFGPTGWKRCPLPGANKKFLQNTIMNAMSSNKVKEQRLEGKLGKIKSKDRIKHKEELKSVPRKDSGASVKKKDEKYRRTEKSRSRTYKEKLSCEETKNAQRDSSSNNDEFMTVVADRV